jgi:hypothetical protein
VSVQRYTLVVEAALLERELEQVLERAGVRVLELHAGVLVGELDNEPEQVLVWAPRPDTLARSAVDRASGIVGSREGGSVVLDYEGNRYGAANVRTFADRVRVAYGRHTTRYPTVARIAADEGELVELGYYTPATGEVTVHGHALGDLLEWLGVDVLDPAELEPSATVRRPG